MDVLLKFTANWILPVIFFLGVFSFCTMIIVELLDARLRFKARLLDQALRRILGANLRDKFFFNIMANPLAESSKPSYLPADDTFTTIIMHWLVRDYGFPKRRSANSETPQAIRQTIESLSGQAPVLASLLEFLLSQAEIQDLSFEEYYDHFERGITQWFYTALNRVSVQYKQLAEVELMLVGLIVAVVANFDVINMVASLWKAALIKELADLYQKANQPLLNIDSSLFTSLPLGWQSSDWELFSNPVALVIKITGLGIGGFLIAICSRYLYEYFKKKSFRSSPSQDSTARG